MERHSGQAVFILPVIAVVRDYNIMRILLTSHFGALSIALLHKSTVSRWNPLGRLCISAFPDAIALSRIPVKGHELGRKGAKEPSIGQSSDLLVYLAAPGLRHFCCL